MKKFTILAIFIGIGIALTILIAATPPITIGTADTIAFTTSETNEPTIPETSMYVEDATTFIEETQVVEETVPVIKDEEVKKEETVSKYRYGKRVTPAVEIDTSNGVRNFTGEVDTSGFKYYGKMTITGYAPKCAHCCGGTDGITASGVEAITGYTVATGSKFKFGTTLYIEGYGFYVVEDRGVGNKHIDIAADDHKTCYSLTKSGVDVYIVPNTQ